MRQWIVSILMGVVFTTGGMQAQTLNVSLDSNRCLWKVKPQEAVTHYLDLFTDGYNTEDWVTATVPGTVFGAYVVQGLEEDPNFGDNIYRVDKTGYNRNFWYRTEFTVPRDFTKKNIWLNFEGINRRGDVYVNRRYVGSVDGFYERGKFDITSAVNRNEKNVLAVLVEYPKEPIPNYTSPTYIASAGWDWMPYVPGLLSGITDDVYLSNTGPVQIVDPWIRTEAIKDEAAELSIAVKLTNQADQEISGELTAVIQPGNINISRNVRIRPHHFSDVTFDASNEPSLAIQNPRLWWPNGYGDQPLYTCGLQFKTNDAVSDSKTIQFGVRKYSYDTDGNVLHISVNGKRIFLKGGNWGMSEYMLRCRGDEYDTKIHLHKEMNYNMIRNWIGSTTDEEFYQACDKYGIMVWDDFWLNSHPNLPRDVFAFNKNAVEKIKRLRNYACIAVWCGDNEGYPMAPLNDWLREDIRVYDGGDRRYHPNSHSDALSGSGIWVNLEPKGYFASPPMGFGGERGWGLRTEIGTAVFTNFESFKKFMPKESWWPRNEMWDKHFFGRSAANAGPDRYYQSLVDRYGEPDNIEDFCKKAQLVNIETNKAMYEGWVNHIWDDASGILIWMSQSAYPSFVWQTYDYYYDLNGAYWGAKKGCEPIHIFWDCATNDIRVANTSSNDLKRATATAAIYNIDGREVPGFQYTANVAVPSNHAATCFTLQFEDTDNLAFRQPAFASSTAEETGGPEDVTDGGVGSRWGSAYSDPQWIYVDLGKVQPINEIHLFWEDAYAVSYKLQVSNDAESWKDVYINENGQGGREKIQIDPVQTRYVRMLGLKRATMWGYSLWEMQVFNKDRSKVEVNPLSDVHFIKLALHDNDGKLLSENFYWRGNDYLDYTALNQLSEVDLSVRSTMRMAGDRQLIEADLRSPTDAPNVAFAVRVMLVNERTGEQVLPVFMNDNYFSLVPGESRHITMEYDPSLLNGEEPKIVIKQYASDVSTAAKQSAAAVRDTASEAGKQMSGNPLFDGWYADPEVIIYDQKYWIYPTYSASYENQTFFDCFSSPDLVHWTKHERILDTDRVKWAKRAMWAPSVIEKDGKYYFFFGANDVHEGQIGGIGVAVADRPEGPYRDLIGKPLINQIVNGAQPIDQYVFKNKEDGAYYMYYGGWGHCNIVKLDDSFTKLVPFEDGTRYREVTPQGYVEGPCMFQKDGKYYFMWSEGGWGGPNYSVAYAISDSLFGPFKRIGKILQQDIFVATGAGHHSVMNIPGTDQWYIVYHRRPLTKTDANHRVTCIDRVEFDQNGRIKPVKITFEGVGLQRVP